MHGDKHANTNLQLQTDEMDKRLEEEEPQSGISKLLSSSMKNVSISLTTQCLSADTTKRIRSKACCSETYGPSTKSQLEIKERKKKGIKEHTME